MPREKRSDRPIKLTISLPETVLGEIQLSLYSSVSQRIPYGAISELFTQLAREWLLERKKERIYTK